MAEKLWNMFVDLVRGGLWEQAPACVHMPYAKDWDILRTLAREHAVGGLLYRGMALLPEEQMPPSQMRMALLADADAISKNSRRLAAVQTAVLAEFSRAGVPVAVKKGSEAAKFYVHPELRESGDIDLFCPRFGDAVGLFPDAKLHPDGSAALVRNGVVIELHPEYFDLPLPPSARPEIPSRTAELLMLSVHILKHALGPGIGLKQLCDMARALSQPYDADSLCHALKAAGLLCWHRLLCSYLVEDLGLDPECCGLDFRPCNPKALRKIVMRGGNFGFSGGLRRRTRGAKPLVRKAATALGFLGHLPFSLRYAPRYAFCVVSTLVRGNLRR